MLVVFNRRYKTQNQKQTGISRVSAMPMNTRRLILSHSLAALGTVLALIWSGVTDCCPHITFLQPTCDTKKERIKKRKIERKKRKGKKKLWFVLFFSPGRLLVLSPEGDKRRVCEACEGLPVVFLSESDVSLRVSQQPTAQHCASVSPWKPSPPLTATPHVPPHENSLSFVTWLL